MAELVHGPIATERLLALAARPDCGALVLFLGTTRDHDEGRRVTRLFYEAYRPMALAALTRIERETAARFPVGSCHIVHRLGEVMPTEAGVAVVVAAAHRDDAFEACRWAMDQVKGSAPIWKQEQYADGGSRWMEGAKLG